MTLILHFFTSRPLKRTLILAESLTSDPYNRGFLKRRKSVFNLNGASQYENAVYIGFSSHSGFSDHSFVVGPPSLYNSDCGNNDIKIWRFLRKNPLKLKATCGFSDLDPFDGDWSQNPV